MGLLPSEHAEYWGRLGSPAGQGARAQLILALLLAAIVPMTLLDRPVQTHAVKLDLPGIPAGLAPPPATYEAWSTFAPGSPEPPRRLHRLVLTPQEKILFDGIEVDWVGLRMRLDRIEADGADWIDFRPEPNARYEFFLEVLAVTRRARIKRLRLDNRALRQALDETGEGRLP